MDVDYKEFEGLDSTDENGNAESEIELNKTQESDFTLEQLERLSKSKDQGNVIPQSRFNEAIAKERAKQEALNQENITLKEQMQALQNSVNEVKQIAKETHSAELTAEIKELQNQAREALLDANDDVYNEAQAKIYEIIRQQTLKDAEDNARKIAQELINEHDSKRAQAKDEDAIAQTLIKWFEEYPQLDKENNPDGFDEELFNATMMLQNSFVDKRKYKTGNEALVKALEMVVGKKSDKKQSSEKAKDDRTENAIKRGIEKSGKQSPSITSSSVGERAGDGEPMIDWEGITDEDFAKLPQAVIDRAKGKKK